MLHVVGGLTFHNHRYTQRDAIRIHGLANDPPRSTSCPEHNLNASPLRTTNNRWRASVRAVELPLRTIHHPVPAHMVHSQAALGRHALHERFERNRLDWGSGEVELSLYAWEMLKQWVPT